MNPEELSFLRIDFAAPFDKVYAAQLTFVEASDMPSSIEIRHADQSEGAKFFRIIWRIIPTLHL